MNTTTQPHIHPPHQEVWQADTGTMLNRDGDRHTLEAHRITEFGLYGRRTFRRHHARAFGQRVWLLPELGLRVISWIPRPEAQGLEDYYIDIARISVTGDRFTMIDYYLDIRVWTGRRTEVIDQDEFVQAIAAGHLDATEAEWALTVSYQALEGIARHGDRLEPWLSLEHGIELTWS
jgi:predicted RNA-binding protein associated with RNAse of E/G family